MDLSVVRHCHLPGGWQIDVIACDVSWPPGRVHSAEPVLDAPGDAFRPEIDEFPIS